MRIFGCVSLVLSFLLGISQVQAAEHTHSTAVDTQISSSQAEYSGAPKLIVLSPRADFLKDGNVYLPFRVENMTILPLYAEVAGDETTKLKPTIGHLHVMVDDTGWKWIHASTDPIYFGQLSPGHNKIELELVDSTHSVIEVQSLKVDVPEKK